MLEFGIVIRSTYIINEAGMIELLAKLVWNFANTSMTHVFPKINILKHSKDILNALR